MKKSVMAVLVGTVLIGMLLTGGRVQALTLPSFGPGVTMGESDLIDYGAPGVSDYLTIDWMVMPSVFNPGMWSYLYQVEVSKTYATHVSAFGVTFDTVAAGIVPFGGVGFLAGDNLDALTAFHSAHVVTGEWEPGLLQPLVAPSFMSVSPGSVTWLFPNAILQGGQSVTLGFDSLVGPTYGNADAKDGQPPSPWGSANGGQQVPIPNVPDGGVTVLLLGSALVGMVMLWRRMSK